MSNITNWQNSRNESFLIVPTEKGSREHYLSPISEETKTEVIYYCPIPNDWNNTEIPSAKYTLILDLDNATEEQAMQVSNSIAGRYIDHDKSDLVKSAYTSSSKESLHSLARSLKLDTENYNYVILKVNQ